MSHITIIDRAGQKREAALKGQGNLMQLIRDAGLDELQAICGGSLSCGTCHVYIDGADAGVPSEGEMDLLDSSPNRRPQSRLSCQIDMTSLPAGAMVTLAPED